MVPKVDQKVIPKVEFWGSDENPRCGTESENDKKIENFKIF